jgi:hypothetical protein
MVREFSFDSWWGQSFFFAVLSTQVSYKVVKETFSLGVKWLGCVEVEYKNYASTRKPRFKEGL